MSLKISSLLKKKYGKYVRKNRIPAAGAATLAEKCK
jgi:hypothetical protein